MEILDEDIVSLGTGRSSIVFFAMLPGPMKKTTLENLTKYKEWSAQKHSSGLWADVEGGQYYPGYIIPFKMPQALVTGFAVDITNVSCMVTLQTGGNSMDGAEFDLTESRKPTPLEKIPAFRMAGVLRGGSVDTLRPYSVVHVCDACVCGAWYCVWFMCMANVRGACTCAWGMCA